MVSGITVEDGKFAVYASRRCDDLNPYKNLKPEEDGAGCVLQDLSGRFWVFYIAPSGDDKYDLKRYYSDNGGISWSTSAVVRTDVTQGVPDVVETVSGRIVVYHFKTVDGVSYLYKNYTDNGGTVWVEEQAEETLT